LVILAVLLPSTLGSNFRIIRVSAMTSQECPEERLIPSAKIPVAKSGAAIGSSLAILARNIFSSDAHKFKEVVSRTMTPAYMQNGVSLPTSFALPYTIPVLPQLSSNTSNHAQELHHL
jgi:hypothetical protein